MKVKVTGNVTEQIRAGVEPWESAEIEITLAELTPQQRDVLAEGYLGSAKLIHATPQAVIAALQSRVDELEKENQREREAQAKRDREALEWCANPTIVERVNNHYGVKFSSWSVSGKPYFGLSPEVSAKVSEVYNRLEAELAERNRLAQEAAQPAIEAAKAEAERKAAEEKAAREAEKQARFKRRLETGIVEIPMTRGDRSEWGEPWIAKLHTRNGRKPEYDFSAGKYDAATETLSIPCKPGEIIAYGQKNYRKPKRTIHNVRRMRDDGALVEA